MESITADVLIVTVTPVESRAVLQAFKHATGNNAQSVSIGDRVYRDLGTVNGAKIFMALSEMGAGGLGAAQQAVQKGIEALQPHAVIMVGIAFGVNEQKQAIGDILVSKQLMLYESQRVSVGEIISRGDKAHSAARLVNYLQNAYLDWDGADVRFGLVLTGEKLVDDLDYRESLKKLEFEAIGGEMEGAGLYVSCQDAKVDWILVKAICDWADGNKDHDKRQRQQQAAENATAFVLHALQHAALPRLTPLPNSKVSAESQQPTRQITATNYIEGYESGGNIAGRDINQAQGDIVHGNKIIRNVTGSSVGDSVVTAGKVSHSFNKTEIHHHYLLDEQTSNLKNPNNISLEKIRLDVASPSSVFSGIEFDVAVAIRQPSSPPLNVADLNNNLNAKGIIERASKKQIVTYRVEITSSNFIIVPKKVIFNLEYSCDSEVKWFKLVAKRSGQLSFLVIAYQVDGDIEVASTRVVLESIVKSLPNASDLWKEKLDYLLVEEVKNADPARGFQLKIAIEEAQQKIRELGG
jgi:nucleoside phosphorylase